MKQMITIVAGLLFIVAGCRKEAGDSLPLQTHTGANTFGCKVDGKVYAASGKSGFESFVANSDMYYAVHTLGGNYINIYASNFYNPHFVFEMTIPFVGGTGTYSLNGGDDYAVFQNKDIVDTGLLSKSIFSTTGTDTGSVTITYFNGTISPLNGGSVIAGTFQLSAVNEEGKTIHITDGRFDIGK